MWNSLFTFKWNARVGIFVCMCHKSYLPLNIANPIKLKHIHDKTAISQVWTLAWYCILAAVFQDHTLRFTQHLLSDCQLGMPRSEIEPFCLQSICSFILCHFPIVALQLDDSLDVTMGTLPKKTHFLQQEAKGHFTFQHCFAHASDFQNVATCICSVFIQESRYWHRRVLDLWNDNLQA